MEEYKQIMKSLDDFRKENREDHQQIKEKYVTKDRFLPVEKIVYGGVGLILLTVVGALIATVVRAAI